MILKNLHKSNKVLYSCIIKLLKMIYSAKLHASIPVLVGLISVRFRDLHFLFEIFHNLMRGEWPSCNDNTT